jgi:hypothetical protein
MTSPLFFVLLDRATRRFAWSGSAPSGKPPALGFVAVVPELHLGSVAAFPEKKDAQAAGKALKVDYGLESVVVPVRVA